MDFLEGPTALDELYSEEFSLHIYSISDFHVLSRKCNYENKIEISLFIEQAILSNSNILIDIFLETEFLARGLIEKNPYLAGRKEDTYIGEIVRMFPACFSLDKRECGYANLRPHYTDFRIGESKCGIRLLDYIKVFYDIEKDYIEGNDNLWYETIERIKETLECVIQKLESSSSSHIVEAIVDVFDYNGIMRKQATYVPSEMRKRILEFLSFRVEEEKLSLFSDDYVEEVINHLKKTLKYLSKKRRRLNLDKLLAWLRTFDVLSIYVLDYYLFMGIFRRYGDRKVENTIVYSGERHTANLRQFLLDWLGFEHRFSSETCDTEKCYQCVDIRGLRQPLFQK